MNQSAPPAGVQACEDLNLPNSPIMLSWGFFWLCALIGAYMPLLPVYLSHWGVTASGFAVLLAVQATVALVLTQVVGYVADMWMRRTHLLLLMSLGGALAAALFPWLPPKLIWFALGVGVMSIFFSQRGSIYNALILDSNRGEELYPRIRMMGSLGFVMVTPLVGWLADRPWLGPAVMWPCIVVVEVVIAVMLLTLRDEHPGTRQGPAARRVNFREAQRILFGNRLVLRFLLFTFLTQWVAIPGHSFQTMMLAKMEVSPQFVTACVTWAALWELVIFWWGKQIVDRFGVMNLMMIVPVCAAIRFGIIYIKPTPWVIFASNTLHFITFGLAYLCGVIFVNREIPRELKSSGQALFAMVFGTISMLVGNVGTAGLMRYLVKHFEVSDQTVLTWWYGAAALAMVPALIAFFPMRREYVRRHGLFVSGTSWRRG